MVANVLEILEGVAISLRNKDMKKIGNEIFFLPPKKIK